MRLPLRYRSEDSVEGQLAMYRRLEKNLPQLKGGPFALPDFSRGLIYGEYDCNYLVPRLNAQPSLEDFGMSFSLYYERHREKVMVYAITRGNSERISKSFELERGDPLPRKYAAFLIPRSEGEALRTEYILDRGIDAVFALPPETGLLFSASVSPKLERAIEKRIASMRRNPKASARPLEEKLSGKPMLLRMAIFADDRETAERCGELMEKFIVAPVKWRIRRVKRFEDFYRLLLPPEMPRMSLRVLNATYRSILKLPLLPYAGSDWIEFTRFAKMLSADISRGALVLGRVEDKIFSLDPSDLYRHAYIIGGTGSGKTNLLKIIIKGLHDLGYPVFVIDPHGELSEEMAKVIGDSVYLHPVHSPFGINPLELPAMKDRNQQVLMSVDELMNLFSNAFHLPETAMNVRYILQTVTRQIYKHGGVPTLAGLYKVITAIYNGQDVGISDQQFREEEKTLRNMPSQSFVSTLSRLQIFAADSLLRAITSSTTIDIGRFLEEKRTVFFSLPQRHIGLTASTLLASTILLKIYYAKLIRHGEKRDEHVFVVIDEFQTLQSLPILATILSEARKFGLHLIVAHQYAKQLSDDVRQAAITNAGVKFIFNVSGEDVGLLATVDPGFEKEIRSLIGSLSTGHCVVKLGSRAGDESLPPLLLKVNEFMAEEVRTIEQARTEEFRPKDVPFGFEMINPIFRYIDPPFVIPQRIIQVLISMGGSASIGDISDATGLKQETLNRVISMMASKGYVRKTGFGNRMLVSLSNGFIGDFLKSCDSGESRELIERAVNHYIRNGYYVAKTKTGIGESPKLVCIPFDGQYLDYQNAVEVEIAGKEELTEIMKRASPFIIRHVWCSAGSFQNVLDCARKWACKRTVIFAVFGDGLKVEEVEVGSMFGKKKLEKLPDSEVEGSFVKGLDKDIPEESPEKRVSPTLKARVALALGNDLAEKIRAQGLMDDLLKAAAEGNLSREEITEIALKLLKMGEEAESASVQTGKPVVGYSIESLAKLNPRLSAETVMELYEMLLERFRKIISLGLDSNETIGVFSEILEQIDYTAELLSAPAKNESSGEKLKDGNR
ncbi:MAG: hypothetical protein DSO01_08335 [Archaeoglobi archaeon]|nr:MAG: hypothetical protein DSO01_08335 [Archaeoglobi archaeon]